MEKLLDQIQESFTLLNGKIWKWMDEIVLSLPNLILVFVTLFIGLKLMKYANRLIARIVAKSFPANQSVQNLVNNVAAVFLYLILGVILLAILGLQGPITTVLASAGVAGLALGLALQDPLMNLFSGIIMSVKHVFDVGDFIESNGFIGEVKMVSLKSTELRMLSGEEVSIPNKLVLQNPVKNFSTNGNRRVEIICGISYGDDLERVKEIALAAVRPLAMDTVVRPAEFIYTGFGDSAINFQLRFWINPPTVWEFLNTKSMAIMKLKAAFDQNDITIPFPIRTLDFGIKGGVTLQENIGIPGMVK